ncbi:hypothetical protein [Dactylosporangium sp. NPDC005555]|uniref:hypothetical protein n=1 Tax=Dactylosporangium sp. NPDC005555 TaxID=3154889 RepID=UPI00339DDFF7
MRIAEGLLFMALMSIGGTLFGHAVVSVGWLRQPTNHRMWGTLGALPRGRFAAYFGVLGFAWLTIAVLLWFGRGESYTVPIVGALGALVAILVIGWIAAVVRNRKTPVT